MQGKTLVFTDIHFGINSDKPSRQKIASDVVDEIANACIANGVKQILFLGDLFHHRTSIEVSTLNLADAAVTKLTSVADVYLIQGNHDLYEKSGRSLSSTSIFTKHKAHVIAKPTEVDLNGASLLLAPWCGDGRGVTLASFAETCGVELSSKRYDLLMGHFNLSDYTEIERAFSKIKGTLLKNESGVGELLGGDKRVNGAQSQAEELFTFTHPTSQIFMGHIHEHQECIYGRRLFHIVGSPQMQTHDLKGLDPNRKRHGYYIMDENNRAEFFEVKSAPKFVTVYASEIRSPTAETKKKLASLNGCIIKRCYDCALNEEQQKEFDTVVDDSSILEEDSAAFTEENATVVAESSNTVALQENLVFSKEDYLRDTAASVIHECNPELEGDAFDKMHKHIVEKLMDYYSTVKV